MACEYHIDGKVLSEAEFKKHIASSVPSVQILDERYYGLRYSIPDMPFKNDKWVELVTKKAIQMAAQGGYEGIAWINGEQTQDRYDLSKTVEYVKKSAIYDQEDGYQQWIDISTENALITLVVGKDGIIIDNKNRVINGAVGKHLDTVIGKEIAAKILEAPVDTKLSGLDLKIGGEWAKNLYDKQIPKLAEKYARQFGGKVTSYGFAIGSRSAVAKTTEDIKSLSKKGFVFINPWPTNNNDKELTKQQAYERIEKGSIVEAAYRDAVEEQFGIEITPELQSNVAAGVPMFMIKNPPKIVYHGSNKEFDGFRNGVSWFAEDKEVAEEFGKRGGRRATIKKDKEVEFTPIVYGALLNLKNPLKIDDIHTRQSLREILKQQGLSDDSINGIFSEIYDNSKIAKEIKRDFDKGTKAGLSSNRIDWVPDSLGFSIAKGTWAEKKRDVVRSAYEFLDVPNIVDVLKRQGFDGVITTENGKSTFAVFDGGQQASIIEKNGTPLFMQDGDVLGFTDPSTGEIYLNNEALNPNTPIHEAGHLWLKWAKDKSNELYKRGMELVDNTRYLKKVQDNKFYQDEASKLGKKGSKAYDNYMREEALAMAIGDKGAQFVTEARQNSFKAWATELWNAVAKAVGFKGITADEIQNLTFDEFTKRAAADILKGGEIQDQQQEQTSTEPETDFKDLANRIKNDEIKYIDAIEGKDQGFIDSLNKAMNLDEKKMKPPLDQEAFKASVKKMKSLGYSKDEIISEKKGNRKTLPKNEMEIIEEVFFEQQQEDAIIEELKEIYDSLDKGLKPKKVLKSLSVSNVTEMVRRLSDALQYRPISNKQLEEIADYIVGSMDDLDNAKDYLNSMVGNMVDVKQLIRAKVVIALQSQGKVSIATSIIQDMADEANTFGRSNQSLKRAYELLGSKGSPKVRSVFAERYVKKVQDAALKLNTRMADVISDKDMEIKELNEKIHEMTQKSGIGAKLKELIDKICNVRRK